MFQTLDQTQLKKLFFELLRIRRIEEKIIALYPEQQMRCPVHLSIGQEAVAVGVCHNLRKEDLAMSGHRSHGHYLAKGGDLKRFFAEIYGRETGCCQGRGGSMHLIDLSVNFWGATPIVGGSIPVAAGLAFADHLQKRKTVTAIFLGDAAVEEGVFHETINFAALKKLPILFVCENNLYSVNTHIKERQPARPIYQVAKGHGVSASQENGNDLLKVAESSACAIEAIRNGQGPVFIEYLTYRYREHCGPNEDLDSGYRSRQEFAEWQARCPVRLFEKYILQEGIFGEKQVVELTQKIDREIEEAVAFAQKSPFPKGPLSQKDVYA